MNWFKPLVFNRYTIGLLLSFLPILLLVGGHRVWLHVVEASPAETAVSHTLSFSSTTYTRAENGSSATIIINLSSTETPTQTMQIEYLVLPGTATEGVDYIETSGILTFTQSITSRSFTVVIQDDTIDEPNETVNLVLRNPVNAIIGTGEAVLTITDNDPPPTNTPVSQPTSTALYIDLYEQNNNLNSAYTVYANDSAACDITLWPVGDVDFFRFEGKAGSVYEVETSNLDGGIDTYLTVYDTQGNVIDSNDDYQSTSRASFVQISAHVDGFYFARIVNQASVDPADQRYCFDVTEIQGTSTPAPTATPSRIPINDDCDEVNSNLSFQEACFISVDEIINASFVPVVGDGPDNDFYRLWVKAGFLYTCETSNLSSETDTNLILYLGPGDQYLYGGNDDREPGDLSSELSYYATYTGWLYALVGPVHIPEYEYSGRFTYRFGCSAIYATPTPSPTATRTPYVPPTGGGGGGGGGSFPTRTPTRTPTVAATTTPIVITVGPPDTPTPTPRPNVEIQPLPTSTPFAPPAPQSATIDVVIYYDENNNYTPELPEGVMDLGVALYDQTTGQLLAFGYTNEAGSVRFGPLATQGAVRVSVPYLNVEQSSTAGTDTILIRVAPGTLPGGTP
ncbi:MAG TPA: Calx-beta domain-containing protein [Anaerolineae bacterium]|nr:Calx-beta domain-containing protein [Anaerolineae bacterium]